MNLFKSLALAFGVWVGTVAQAAEFFVIPGSTTLLLLGETSSNDIDALRNAVKNDKVETIVLKGPGGNLEAAFTMADFIIEHKLATVVPENTDCASACSLIFLAGSKRTLEKGARLGFHLPFLSGDAEITQFRGLCKTLDAPAESELLVGYQGVPRHCVVKVYQMGLRDIRRLNSLVIRDGISERLMDIIIDTMPEQMAWVDGSRAAQLGIVSP